MIRWGVIGLGNIAKRFINGLSYSQQGKLYAVASRGGVHVEELLQQYPQVHIYHDYQELINDSNIDAVYIALRHNDHYQWAKEALLHHKAVLCEKPMTLTYAQTKELCDLSQKENIFLMEAMKTRFIPLIDDIKNLIEQGKLGDIQKITTSFCSDVPYMPLSYLYDEKQGGALYDVGIYNIAFILDMIKDSLYDINVYSEKKYEVDAYDYIELFFKNKTTAIIEVSIDRYLERTTVIQGSKGTLTAEPFYRPVDAVVEYHDGQSQELHKEYEYDDFYGEIEEVHRCIQNKQYESKRMTHQDSLDAIALIEKIKENPKW